MSVIAVTAVIILQEITTPYCFVVHFISYCPPRLVAQFQRTEYSVKTLQA